MEVRALNRTEKEQTIATLQKQIEQYRGAVLANFRGLTVEQINQIRQRLREEKVSFHVVKNTLMKLASRGTDFEKVNQYLEGPTAIAISYGNPVSLIKILLDFVRTQPLLEIKVGLVEGQLVSPQELKGIATLPSRETMMAQVMGTIQMPASQLAGAIINPIQQLLYVFQTRRDQMAAAEGSGS